jgi:prepilin-type N-terminal cleavage/methylation domain-containing protein
MAKGTRFLQAGFSLVELMVAVMFIGILMAGMANVFKSSVSTLATSSDGISSARRNRMSIDLLYDDLNTAGLYLTDLSSPPPLAIANPAFYILPNMPIVGATADDPQTADELFFYLDQPLPFEGTLTFAGAGATVATNNDQQVMNGVSASVADSTFAIECQNSSYANMVKAGCSVIFKDSGALFSIPTAPTVTGTTVHITTGPSPTVGMTGRGSSGSLKDKHINTSGVMFFLPAQVVHYAVRMKFFDPQKPTGIPCLVREQDVYNPAGWDPASPTLVQSIIAENVSGFKVYLSADSGQPWVGFGKNYTGFTAGWAGGMRTDLDAQLALSGRVDVTTTQGDENWFRDIPILVRLDITTRTATKRAEYAAVPTTTAYKNFTQSLVIVPRHAGLTMN